MCRKYITFSSNIIFSMLFIIIIITGTMVRINQNKMCRLFLRGTVSYLFQFISYTQIIFVIVFIVILIVFVFCGA